MTWNKAWMVLAAGATAAALWSMQPEASAAKPETGEVAQVADPFLDGLIQGSKVATVNLTTGKSIQGRLRSYDGDALLVDTGTQQILVYKHAIETVHE